jgi:hypothetical protein
MMEEEEEEEEETEEGAPWTPLRRSCRRRRIDSFARKRIDSRLNNGFFETMMSQILKHYWMAGCRKVCLRHPCRD